MMEVQDKIGVILDDSGQTAAVVIPIARWQAPVERLGISISEPSGEHTPLAKLAEEVQQGLRKIHYSDDGDLNSLTI